MMCGVGEMFGFLYKGGEMGKKGRPEDEDGEFLLNTRDDCIFNGVSGSVCLR